jgi:hypothetical protein
MSDRLFFIITPSAPTSHLQAITPCCPSSSSRRLLVVSLPFLPFLAILPLILRSSVSSYRLFDFSILCSVCCMLLAITKS